MKEAPELCDDGCADCRTIIVRTYRELRQTGTEDYPAFNAALRVFSLRHPERKKDALPIVSQWISEVLEY